MRNGRRADKARVYRRNRTPLRAKMKVLAAAYRQVPAKRLLTTAGLLLVMVFAGAFASHANPAVPVLGTAGAMVLLHLVMYFPAQSATVAVLGGYLPFSVPVGGFIAYAASGASTDGSTGALTLFVALALTAMVAHRTTRGAPWLTVLIAAVAITLIGPLLLWPLPFLGFGVVYAIAAVVLFLRGGGVGWTATRSRRVQQAVARLRSQMPRKQSLSDAEEKTAAHLADLDSSYTVLHDLLLPRGVRADHLLIGPTGVYLLETQSFTGAVREDAKRGLVHRDRPLAGSLSGLLAIRRTVAEMLGINAEEVQPLVVIHEAVLPAPRSRVALFDSNGERLGDVLVLAPSALNEEISSGPEVFSSKKATRLARRARRRLLPADAGEDVATAAADDVESAPADVQASLIDADGHRVEPQTAEETPSPMFRSTSVDLATTIGQRVSVLTDLGVLDGFRVVSEQMVEDDGVITVALTPEEDWLAAQQNGGEPMSAPVPVASVQPM